MISDFSQAFAAITDFWADYRSALTEDQQGKLRAIVNSFVPPEKVSQFAEFVYANQESFNEAAKAVASDVCLFATNYAFYGLGEDGRGLKIASVLRGDDVSDAPQAKAEYTPATNSTSV